MMQKITMLLFALLLFFGSTQVSAQAAYDTLSIYDLQFVADPGNDDLSPFVGDTIVVRALLTTGPRDLWIGARWSAFCVDPDNAGQPWSGFFLVQNDTFATQTNFGFLEPGVIAYFTGVVSEFSQFSQISLLTDPLVPVTVESSGNPLPAPVELTAAELDQANGEQWESMLVKVNDATVVNNAISGNWASINDGTGTTYIAEYSLFFNTVLNAGSYTWPSNGININVTGHMRDESGTPGQVFTVNPMTLADLDTVGGPPPVISVDAAARDIGAPTSSQIVTITAEVTDPDDAVSEVLLYWSVDEAPYQQATMTVAVTDTFQTTIPAQSDGAFVRYFIKASDVSGNSSLLPGDTSRVSGEVYFYDVRDNGVSIRDLQDTRGYASGNSGYAGYEVTVEGRVMTDSSDFVGDYFIQDDVAAWSGIWVNDGTFTHLKGDEIRVTGTVEENFGVTRIDDVTASDVVTAGVGAWDAVEVTTGELGNNGANNEAYESVYIYVQNLTVTNPFPDGGSNFGEFEVDDGTGPIRVDDFASAYRGNLDTLYMQGANIAEMRGFNYFSFGNWKIIPSDSNDVSLPTLSVDDDDQQLPKAFALEQNYPNPFNPTTEIRYSISDRGVYTMEIFNVLGQRVRMLNSSEHAPGTYRITWNGRNESGAFVGSGLYFYRISGEGYSMTRKMILMK